MTNIYPGTRQASRFFSWTGLLLGALLLICNVSHAYARGGDRTPAARHYAVCSNYAQHLTVAGNMPVTANVTAVPVEANTPDGKPAVAAFDITITNGGREWQPAPGDPVLVTLTDKKFVDGKLLDIYHQGPDGPEFVGTVMPKNGTITFPGYSFSVYIVGESQATKRLKVNFYNGTNLIASYYVKPNDTLTTADYDKVVYDPGAGTVPAGRYFFGWYTQSSYSVDDAPDAMTIVDVRNDLKNHLRTSFADGEEVNYYAMIYRTFVVTYLDNGIGLGSDNVLALRDSTSANYRVYQDYTAEEGFNLEGWYVSSEDATHIAAASGTLPTPIPQNTNVVLTGDVTLSADVESGHWLVYNENGSGAKYNAPAFVKSDQVTQRPCPDSEMIRFGYEFDGWYNGYTDVDSTSPTFGQNILTTEFTFGGPITKDTTIFAKWRANATANYTVIIWKQNISGNGYDFERSITLSGNVGSTVNTVSQQSSGNSAYARINGTDYQYTGFHLNRFDNNVVIKTEGNAIVNVYYDRTEYTLHFQAYDRYTESIGDYDNNPEKYGIVNGSYQRVYWRNGAFRTSNNDNATVYNGTVYTRGNNNWHDIKTITALYGQSIAQEFPIVGFENYSWTAQSSNIFSTSAQMAFLDVMPNESTVFHGEGETGSYRYPFRYYVEALPTDVNTVSYNGKTFVLYTEYVYQSSSGTLYSTFEEDFVNLLGFERYASNPVFDSWTTSGRTEALTRGTGQDAGIKFYYLRKVYPIVYFDGVYVDGNNNTLSEVDHGQLHIVSNIAYNADVSSYNKDQANYYIPAAQNDGFVFEGWFLDKNCTQSYTFNTMPEGGIRVYAKWRQIQYRVFLHPQVPRSDNTLTWGSEGQATNFRISYNGKVSLPTGVRTNYEFGGWFTDQACTQSFSSVIPLNDQVVTAHYDKTLQANFTDPSDKYGNDIATCNSDSINCNNGTPRDRFWITRKLDLYARWRKIIDGADGINITYDANGGTNAPSDTRQYLDASRVVAQGASTAPANHKFSYWELQAWDESSSSFVSTGVNVYPGGQFTVNLDDAQRTGTTGNYVYSVQLKAHYELEKNSTPTFIVWYNNYTGAATDTLRQDGNKQGETAHADLHINEAVSIPTPAARTGYTFKGWYRKKWTNESDVTAVLTPTECDPDFLYYNNTTNKYYKEAAYTNEATQVAADEANPYDYLYAIWEPDTITFNIPDEFCYGAESGTYTLPTTSKEGITGHWNTASVSTTSDGTYYFTFTPDNGQCISKQVKDTIVVMPRVVATVSGNTEFCAGGNTELSVPEVTGNTYAWSNGETTAAITVNAANTYSVTVTDASGCESTGSATVAVNTLPVVNSITVPTGDICPGTGPFTVTGNVTAGTGTITTYTWTGATGTTATASVAEPSSVTERCNKTYSVTLKVKDDKNCESDPVTNTFTVKDETNPTIGDDNLDRTLTSTNCTFTVPDLTGEVRNISSDNCTAPAALEITQSRTAGTALSQPSITTVTVTVKDACGNSSTKDIKLTVPSEPTVNIEGDPNVCYDSTLSLTATGSGTSPLSYAWSSSYSGLSSSTNTLTQTHLTTPGDYTVTVTVTDGNGCTKSANMSGTVYGQLQGGSILYEKIICNTTDTAVRITGTTPASGGHGGHYVWQTSTNGVDWNTVPGVTTEDYSIRNIAQTYVRRIWDTDCDTVCTNVVFVAYSGNVDVGTMTGAGTFAYCYGDNVSHTMTASGVNLVSGADFGYVWYTSTNGHDWTKIEGATGSSYTYEQNPFTQTATIFFKYAIAIENCDTIFANEQVQLDVNMLPEVTVTPNTTQTINLGESIDNVQVTYANGDLDITGMPAGVTNSTLTATPVTISGTPTEAGTFTVKATATSNTTPTCGTAIDSFKIIVNDTLVLEPFVMTATEICASASEINDTVTITETAGNTSEYTYAWDVDGGTILEGQGTQTIKVQWATAGDNKHVKLTVTKTATGGLSHKDDYVDVNPVPTISINDIAEVCPNTEFNVKGNVTGETTPSYAYTWSTTSTGLTVTPATATVTATAYTSHATATGCGDTKELKLTVKDGKNCQVSTTKNVTVKSPADPTIDIATTSSLQETNDLGCNPTSIPTPTASDFTVTDECNSSATVTLTEGTETTDNCTHTKMWTASYKNACNVEATKSITFTWKEMTTPIITTTLNLDSNLTCNWNGPAPTQGNFTVKDDCASSPSVNLAASALDESVACQRSMTWTATYKNACEMKADTVKVTYTWPYDETKPVIASLPDTTATAALNCTYKMPDLSAYTLRRTSDGCSTPTFVSQSVDAGTQYAQTDAQQTIAVTVTVKDECKNEQTATVNVIIPAKLSVTASADPTGICLNGSSTLTATPSYGTGTPIYSWTPSGTLNVANVAEVIATPTTSGNNTYKVTATDENGCSVEKSVTVSVSDSLTIDATPLTQNVCFTGSTPDAITSVEITTQPSNSLSISGQPSGVSLTGNYISGTPTAAGTYTIAITASNTASYCPSVTKNVTVVVPQKLTATAEDTVATCANNDGTTLVTVNGGTAPYTYTYAYKYPSATHNTNVDLTNVNNLNTNNPTGLDTAVYVVTVKDVNDCSTTAEFTVSLKNDLTVTVSTEPQHICSGGSFVITPTAPTGTTYTWILPDQNPAGGYVSGTAAGTDQTTVHGENLVNSYTSTVVLTYEVTPTYGICVGASTPVTVAVDVTTHPVPSITVKDTTVCANIGNVVLEAVFANVTATVDTVSWKFLADSVAHLNAVSASDLTDNNTVAVPATPCNNQTYPYVVYYSDQYGCKSQRSANIIVSMPATITFTGGDADSTIQCAADTIAPHLITPSVMPTVKDACNNDISDQWTLTRPTNNVTCEGTMDFVYTFKNCDDKTATWTYTYTIKRTTPPAEVGGPMATTAVVECVSAATAPASTMLPVVKDACGNTLTAPAPARTEDITGCEGTVTYTYTYKDCVDSQFVWKYVYTIDRTTKPTVNATGIEASKTVACVDSAKVPTTIPTAKGKCDESVTGVLTATTDNPTPLTCEGTRTYTYTYTDCAGDTAQWNYVYTITKADFTLPANESSDITCAADTVMPTPPATPATYCGSLTVTGPVRGGTYNGCSGTKTYTWTYTDCSGNYTKTWTYTYNIATPAAPALAGTWPSDQLTVDACYADKPAFPTKAAVKALYTASCGKTLTVDSVETVVSSDNCAWEIQCEYTITDGCTPVTHTITYKGGDKTKPVIATGYDTELPANVSSCNYTYPDFTTSVKGVSSDVCTANADLEVTQSPAAGSAITLTAAEQTLPVKVYVEDLCGNKDSVEVSVTVPASMALTIDTSASNCYNKADGFLTYTITGGVANYSVALTGNTPATETRTAAGQYTISNLADGTYSLKVTDANGCEATATTTIQQIQNTLTIKANDHNWTYDGAAHSDNGFKVTFGSESHTGTSGTDVTLDNGDVVTGVTVTGTITNVSESPVANAIAPGITVTRNGADITCYYNIDTTFGKLTMNNSGALALNCVDSTKTYDGKPSSYTAVPTVTTGTTVSYSTDGGTTWSTTVPSITNVSESPLTVNVKAENSNYATATCSYTLTINPAPLTIKLDSTKIYDGTAFVSDYATTTDGYTVTGLVEGDAVTAGTVTSSDIHKGDYVYNTTATITTPFATTKGIGNYTVVYDLKQHIDCRDVQLTSGTGSRKYDGTALTNNTVTVSGSGWLTGKEATYSDFASITDKGSKKNAFTYTLASGEVATDYCVSIDTGTLTVTCREITINAASATYPYDGNVHTNTAFTVTGDGMVSGETVTPVIEGSVQFPSDGEVANAITSYTFTPATTTDNYCVTLNNGKLKVECVTIHVKVTADDGNWTYDGSNHTQPSYTVAWVKDGETDTTTATVAASANGIYKFPNGDTLKVVISGEIKNVNTTPVANNVATYSISHDGVNMSGCYDVETVNGELNVTCRTITLTSGTAEKTYNGSALTKNEVSIGGMGMATGESLSFSDYASITDVGSVKNTFKYAFVSPALASNYCVTVDTGLLTVNCKEVTIAANSATRVYNGAPLTESGFTASALESGDSHTFAVTMADTCTITNVGTKANVIATVDGVAVTPGVETAVGNYCVTTSNGTLTVDCKKVTIRAKNASKEYDATPLTQPEFTNTALESGDTHTFTVKMTAASTITDAGTQANVIDTVDGVAVTTGVETAVGNYCVTTEEGTLTVTVVDLPEAVVDMTCPTSGDTTRMYDGTPLAPIVTATSSLSSLDTFHIEYSTNGGTTWLTTPASVTHVSEGTKTVKVRATNPNYKPVYCDFTMQVTCRKDTLLSNAATKVYDGTPLENTTVTVKGDGFVSGETPTYSSFANITDVGKATNTFNYALPTTVDASDYCITVLYDTLEITPAPLTIKLDTQKVYDATAFVSDYMATTDGYTITGLVYGDYITAGVVTSSAADVNTYIDSIAPEATISTPFATNNGIGNYDVTYDLKQVIICKSVTLTAMDSTKVYDGVASTQPGFTATALEATDPHTFAVQMADTCTITNVGTKANVIAKVDGVDITPGTTNTVGNYCVDVVNGVLEITPAPLTIKLDTQKVYDATAIVSAYNNAGYTFTGLVTGDYITAGVVTSSAADVNTYIDSVAPMADVTTAFATNNGISNYDVTYDLKQVIICKAVTLTAMDSTKVYDGVASTQPGFTATALEATDPHTFAVQMADTCTITNVGTKANVIAKVDGVDITPGTTTTVGNYCVDVVNGMLEITPAPLTIKLVSTKVYDSTALVNNYGDAEFTYTGLVSGDAITAGQVKTSGINVGTYIDSIAPEAVITIDFATNNGISNYDVTYDLKQDITCKEVTIKSNGAGKTYDALPLTEPGFTATALEATDPHTFTVTMTSSSTITNVGKQPNIIETVDGVAVTPGPGNVVGNYCVTIEVDTLEVICRDVILKANSAMKEFDGTPLTESGFTLVTPLATTDPHVFTVKMADTCTITNVGTKPNVIDTVDGVHVEPGVSTAVGNYCVTTQNGVLKITPRPLLILDTLSTKVYDGDTLKVDYDNVDVEYIGLAPVDTVKAGQLATDNYIAGYYRYDYTASISTAVMANGAARVSEPFQTAKGISNYAVSYKVKLAITPRPLEITADNATKTYDCTELTKDSYTVTGGTSLATTDVIDTVIVTGSQLCVGESDNVPSGAIILHGTDTVNNSYDITYVNGKLHVEPITTGFTCPADLDITLWHSTCDTNVTLPAEPTLTPSLAAGCVTITNDLHNPLPAGVHTITWSLRDQCDSLMTTCTQTITVNYPKCDTAVDFEGNKYPSERIGCNCWTVPNLKSEKYSDGTPIANYTSYDNDPSKEAIFGKLYSWYSAARVAEGDDSVVPADSTSPSGPYVEGICPAGWALPTVAEYLNMLAASGGTTDLVKSPLTTVWLPGKQGTAPNKFNAYGAGYYDGSIGRYLNLLGETHFWAADYSAGSATAKNFVITHYCSEALVEDALKGLGYSIRCVQKK